MRAGSVRYSLAGPFMRASASYRLAIQPSSLLSIFSKNCAPLSGAAPTNSVQAAAERAPPGITALPLRISNMAPKKSRTWEYALSRCTGMTLRSSSAVSRSSLERPRYNLHSEGSERNASMNSLDFSLAESQYSGP
jgi:hypothetical protein